MGVMHHMSSNNLFSDAQFGFREKRSCTLQLLTVLDDWTKSYDDSYQVDTIYLDIKKAFDTVPHRRLLLKLEEYGINGVLLKWIQNFLEGRKQRVRVNNFYSEWKGIQSGIPQGSVLGPVLFIIYINDLPDVIDSVCKIFADDTKIYRRIHSKTDQEMLQRDLWKVCDWSDEWLLAFSVPKCKSIQFGYVKHAFQYEMRDSSNTIITLPSVEEEKDLGVKFESSLKFNKQVLDVVNRTNRLTGMIKRTFTFMNKYMFLMIYKSLIRSIIDYGITVWYPSSKKNIQLIENVQRSATKLVPELKGLSYQDRLRSLNLTTLLYRRQRYDLIQIFKIVNGLEDIDSERFFTFNDNLTRGHLFRISKPSINKSLRLNMFPVRSIDNWNNLSEDIVLSDSVASFKTKLDKYWSRNRKK